MLDEVFSLLVAVAGWYYLMHAPTSGVLGGVENERVNQRRIRLRRVGGGAMLALAICFYALFQVMETEHPGWKLLYLAAAVALLLVTIVILAIVDLRLTWRLRRQRRP